MLLEYTSTHDGLVEYKYLYYNKNYPKKFANAHKCFNHDINKLGKI